MVKELGLYTQIVRHIDSITDNNGRIIHVKVSPEELYELFKTPAYVNGLPCTCCIEAVQEDGKWVQYIKRSPIEKYRLEIVYD